jgi:hypothetical protein
MDDSDMTTVWVQDRPGAIQHAVSLGAFRFVTAERSPSYACVRSCGGASPYTSTIADGTTPRCAACEVRVLKMETSR